MSNMSVQEPYAARIKAARLKMLSSGISGLLVSRPENRRYLSGYTAEDAQLDESSGSLLIEQERQILLTDFRYKTQAANEAEGFEVIVYQTGLPDSLVELIGNATDYRLGFDEAYLTVKIHGLIEEKTRADMKPVSGLIESLRSQKDPAEVEAITRALQIAESAFQETLEFIKPGRTELEVARYLEEAMFKRGSERPAFETIVASGPNAALPHAVPGDREISEGETIVIDFGAKYNGYGSDITRTVILGEPAPWIKEIYYLVRRAQIKAIEILRPGLSTDLADSAARNIIASAGYGPNFGHGLGHGVGLATHEAPSLSRLKPVTLAPGMVVTVEPGIYLEGRGGVRLEQMALITDSGVRVLNRDQNFYDWS